MTDYLDEPEKKLRYLPNRGRIDHRTLPIDHNGFRCCRYCSGPVKPPKRTFCSPECIHEYRLRTDGQYIRQQLFARDHGVCAICNLDTRNIASVILSLSTDDRKEYMASYSIHAKRKITPYKNGGGLWDADHIHPVKLGGGQCGLENMRTLCIACHRIITFS